MTTLSAQLDASHAAQSTAGIVPSLEGVSESQLAAAFAECLRITRERARNFYYGLKLLPEPRRSGVFAIYGWMREADDCADDGGDIAFRREALTKFAATTRAALGGTIDQSASPMWLALAATVNSYRLDPRLLLDTLDGLAEDLDHAGYATDADLEQYCYRVASTVGLLCVGVWGLRDGLSEADAGRVRELAIARGQAFQLTNILRDFASDYDDAPSRVYLSRESFERMGLTPPQLRDWSQPERCERYVLAQAQRARDYYLASADLDKLIAPDCVPTLWAMTRIYSGLLDVIAADPRRVVAGPRIRLSGVRKTAIALRAMVRSKLAVGARSAPGAR